MMINQILYIGEVTRGCLSEDGSMVEYPNYFMGIIQNSIELSSYFELIQNHDDDRIYNMVTILMDKYMDLAGSNTCE